MAIRVTQVALQVLHSGKIGVTGFGVAQYKHDYTSFDQHSVHSYDVEIGTIHQAGDRSTTSGFDPHGAIFGGAYFLAGFEEFENVIGQAQHDLNAFIATPDAPIGQGTYTLNAFAQLENAVGTLEYQLQAFVILDGQHYGNYDLNAFEPEETVVNSQYELDVFLLAQGFMTGLYSLEVFVDFLMASVSSYDYLTYDLNENVIGTSAYDLNAFELREQAVVAQYALNTLIQSSGFLDSQSAIDVLAALEERFGVTYNLDAFKALDGFADHTYAVDVFQLAELKADSQYNLNIFEALNGFVDATSVLNAYQQADGFTDGQYGISVYVALDGFVDSAYLINALQGVTGYGDGTYLLDTTEELFTWVLNQNTGAPFRYENYGFDAFAAIGQDFLGAKSDGIFLLDGDDDDGADIDAIATIGSTDFGAFYEDGPEASLLKRVTGAYLGVNSSGQIQLTLVTDQGIASGPYLLRQSPTGHTTERSKFRRGVKSRYFQMDIENVDGGDIKLDTIELETKLVEKRLKK